MKTKLILFITVFLLSASLKSQNVKIENDYKNSLSVDVGSFAMLNYHRRIFRKNWYALNGQVGIGSYYESKSELVFIGAININAYLNNIFTIKKHSVIMGLGWQHVIYDSELMIKLGYSYNFYGRFAANLTFYHWIRACYSYENQGYGPSRIGVRTWISGKDEFHPLFSFGFCYYF